jgi:hypothetical protein
VRKSNTKHEPAKAASTAPASFLSADERRAAVFRCARQPAKPRPPKPSSIIAHVDGSGTGAEPRPTVDISVMWTQPLPSSCAVLKIDVDKESNDPPAPPPPL